MSNEQFQSAFPVEFWREVVDRVAQEVPDTLLLAEAFWLMEGYFVRTLGMHRVYNSAFMNMLRDEKNQEYRLVIKNTLEFDPDILKRYVNFMNNPDERTAVDQFGKDDKYFGVCTLLATMPGLPMFGHGQIEGYSEKYGMEFRRAYWEESPDPELVDRHQREIFPLLRKRYIFAEVTDFYLYDFYSAEGNVNEDVFAYSNRRGEEKALIVYHNRFANASGWIKVSAAASLKSGSGDERKLISKSLLQGLDLDPGEDLFTIFRDQVTGFEYIRSNQVLAEQGLFLELDAYKRHVFMDFRQVQDNEWHQYAQLSEYLAGRGVPSIEETLKEIVLQPVHRPFRELTKVDTLGRLLSQRQFDKKVESDRDLLSEIEQKSAHLLTEISNLVGGELDAGEIQELSRQIRREVQSVLMLPRLSVSASRSKGRNFKSGVKMALKGLSSNDEDLINWCVLFGWAFTRNLGSVIAEQGAAERSQSWIDEWLLGRILASSFVDLGISEQEAWDAVSTIKILIRHQRWYAAGTPRSTRAFRILESLLSDEFVQGFLQVNRYQEILWFNQEKFQQLLTWMARTAALNGITEWGLDAEETSELIAAGYQIIRKLQKAEARSDYQVEKLLEAVD
jgi:hypothetical protein